jgi:hypothetical protein
MLRMIRRHGRVGNGGGINSPFSRQEGRLQCAPNSENSVILQLLLGSFGTKNTERIRFVVFSRMAMLFVAVTSIH